MTIEIYDGIALAIKAGHVDWQPPLELGPDQTLEVYYICPICAAETVLEPGITACAGCGDKLVLIMVMDQWRWEQQ